MIDRWFDCIISMLVLFGFVAVFGPVESGFFLGTLILIAPIVYLILDKMIEKILEKVIKPEDSNG